MRTLARTVLGVVLVVGAAAAQGLGDLAGRWRLEPAAVRTLAEGPETRMVAKDVTVAQVGDRVTIDRQVGPTTVRAIYDVGLVDTTNRGLRGEARASRATLEGATLVLEDRETVPQPRGTATVTVTERWTIQPDGALQMAITSTTATSTLTRTYRYVRVP